MHSQVGELLYMYLCPVDIFCDLKRLMYGLYNLCNLSGHM